MGIERKKAVPKEIVRVEPKKRVETKAPIIVEPKKRVESTPVVIIEPKIEVKVEIKKEPILEEQKVKRSKNRPADGTYVRIALDAKAEERKILNERVLKGELKSAYFAVDGNKSYHYYLEIQKPK